MKAFLIEKIKNKSARLGVIGLGYVGLPLAVEKAKAGFQVTGFDVNTQKVDMVNKGINYIGDITDSDLKQIVEQKKLKAASDYSKIKALDCVSICVPTPVNSHLEPDISFIEASSNEIAKYIHQGMLIVLESTTYPGTTREVIKPLLEKSGLKCGEDFFLAFSPERVDPGNKLYNTKNTPKVVGGMDDNSTEVAAALYEEILEGDVFRASDASVAEMEKILENTFRIVNIALANEMAVLCHKMNIDIWEVVEAAKSKPYGFMPFYPGPGVGGHCIPIDPYYLTWKAKEFNFISRLIETSGEINNKMPEYVVERAMIILNRFGKAMNGSNILVLGVAYKQDIDDIRHSPAREVVKLLEDHLAIVSYHDPFIPEYPFKGKAYQSVALTEKRIKDADLVLITAMHTCFDYEWIAKNAAFVFDTKNAMKKVVDRKNIEKL